MRKAWAALPLLALSALALAPSVASAAPPPSPAVNQASVAASLYHPTSTTYSVVRGDSLWAISQRYQVSVYALAAANHMALTGFLGVGALLTLPTPTTSGALSATSITPAATRVTAMKPSTAVQRVGVDLSILPVPAGSMSIFERCVMWRESRNEPTAQNPSSSASGLYGFLTSTFDTVTGLSGPARSYSPYTQHLAFLKLYAEEGRRPWSGSGGC